MENVKTATFKSIEEYENYYRYKPSHTRNRTIAGKDYIVKSYFIGGGDFEALIKKFAIKQANKIVR